MISPTCVHSVLEHLYGLLADSSFTSDAENQYLELIRELEYLKIYVLCLAKWNDSSLGKDKNFGFVEESHTKSALEEAEGKYRMSRSGSQGCDAVAPELLGKIQQCKAKIKKDCLKFLDCPFHCEFYGDELPEFMMCISASLHNLLDLKADVILDVKDKIEYLEDNLDLFKEVFEFATKRCSNHELLKDFKIHTQAWVSCAACLSLLYWVLDAKKENIGPCADCLSLLYWILDVKKERKASRILSDLQKKISPSTPEVTRMYLAVLTASKPSAEDSCTVSKLILEFVQFLKDNLQVDTKKDGIQMLFIELIFLITFLVDRPEVEKLAEGKLILTRADAVVHEVASLISSLSSSEIKEDIAEERKSLDLHNFLEKANAIKAEVRRLYAHLFPDPSSFNFPTINVLGFIDSLLTNLKEFCFHFPKHQIIMMLQEELLSLKESNLKDFFILELQNKYKDIKDLWTRIVNVAYNAEKAVGSFIYMKRTLWHDVLCLSNVIEEVKLIKDEVKRIQDQHMYEIHTLNSETSSDALLPLQANISTVDTFVGFKNEVEEILGRLIRGSPELDFISIVGMPGLGKTTLAKKVYSDASLRYHFHKRAWCTVSQTLNSKRMLLEILRDVDDHWDASLSNKSEEDLAQRVKQSLSGNRYLIVMDDIWNVSAWDALKLSFPKDNWGSRIMFTSRSHNVVSEAKSGCSPFHLNPLSEEESWELLEKKLFEQDSCPPNFVEIGKQLATNCKGLPLTAVLIAGLLKEKIESLDWWKHVGENLDSLIAKEGCMDILELSFKHLPEFLKPCFLYFGSFPEDEEIRVNKLTLLWISEGFVRKQENKSLEVVAREYLMDLVVRSLVIVTKRSSTGGIKACSVHDLLHDFCLAKGEEEKIFKVVRGNEVSHYRIPLAARYAHYRVCIQTECWRSFLEHGSPAPFVHSLLSFHRNNPHLMENLEAQYIHYLTSHFKFLQVLILDLSLPVFAFPEEITEMVLLRSLAISCYYEYIPPSIKRLENLEILCLHNWNLRAFDLPLTTWEMQTLRHVDAEVCISPDFCDDIPPLENIQTFSFARLFYGEAAEMFLRTIPTVRKLECSFQSLGPHMDRNQILKLDFLSDLESLKIYTQ